MAVFDNVSIAQFFKYAKELYAYAPLVGYLYNRLSEIDHEKNPETNEEYDLNIMAEQVISVSEELSFNFGLIMLLDESYEPDEDKRIDKAFRHPGKDPEDEERFNAYIRGGIDVLYEKLIEGGGNPDDYVKRLYDFVDDINERYNKSLDLEALLQLCAK